MRPTYLAGLAVQVRTEPLAGAVRRWGFSMEQRTWQAREGRGAVMTVRAATFIEAPPGARRGAGCWMLADCPTLKLTHRADKQRFEPRLGTLQACAYSPSVTGSSCLGFFHCTKDTWCCQSRLEVCGPNWGSPLGTFKSSESIMFGDWALPLTGGPLVLPQSLSWLVGRALLAPSGLALLELTRSNRGCVLHNPRALAVHMIDRAGFRKLG